VGRPLVIAINLLYIRVFVLLRNRMNVGNVEKLFIVAHTLFNIKKSIKVRNPMNVRNAGKLL